MSSSPDNAGAASADAGSSSAKAPSLTLPVEGESTSKEPSLHANLGQSDWNAMLQRLIAFKEHHGHCNVSPHSSEDPELAAWGKSSRVV